MLYVPDKSSRLFTKRRSVPVLKRRALKFVDMLFERDGIIRGLVTTMLVLASEYWPLVYNPDELSVAVTFTILTPSTITIYVF